MAKGQKCDFEVESFVVHGTQDPCVSSDTAFALGRNSGQENAVLSVALRGRDGGATAELGDEVAGCLRASTGGGDKAHVLAPTTFAIQAGALRTNPNSGPDGVGVQADHAYTLEARAEVQAVCVTGDIAHTLKAEGFDGSEDGTGRGTPLVPVAFMADDYKSGSFVEVEVEVAGPLTTTADRTRGAPIAFSCKDHAADAADDLAPTLRAMNHADSHANAGGQVAVAYTGEDHGNAQEAGPREALLALRTAVGEEAFLEWRLGVAASFWTPEVLRQKLHGAGLRCEADEARRRLDDRPLPRQEGGPAGALREVWEAGRQRRAPQGRGLPEQRAGELDSALSKLSHEGAQTEEFLLSLWRSGEGFGLLQSALPSVQGRNALAVRRLMPVETERLQGFPDGWTMIPWRGKPAELCPDGPRYKAIGNSWAVNVAAWLGARIDAALRGLNGTAN